MRDNLAFVLVPKGNEKDLVELPEDVRDSLAFVLVESMDEVLEKALERPTAAAPSAETGGADDSTAHYAH